MKTEEYSNVYYESYSKWKAVKFPCGFKLRLNRFVYSLLFKFGCSLDGISKHISRNRYINILEIGCGNGELLNRLAAAGYKNLTGVDLVEHNLNGLNSNVKIVNCDIFNYLSQYDGEKFDLIICVDVLEHFTHQQLNKLMNDLNVVASVNCEIIYRVPNSSSVSGLTYAFGDLTHKQLLNESSSRQLMLHYNWDVLTIHGHSPLSINFSAPIKILLRPLVGFLYRIFLYINSAESTIIESNLVVHAKK